MLEAVEDPSVYAMLLLHGIIKQDLYTKVAAVMEEIRPYLKIARWRHRIRKNRE